MIPKYLYHYTSIETLKRILDNQTIKFSRLDTLNDPLEGVVTVDESQALTVARKMVYCSCWSAIEKESISMWGIYTRFKGVRIKACSDLFGSMEGMVECNSGFMPYERITPIDSGRRSTVEHKNIMIDRVFGPAAIEYVSENELIGCVAKNGKFWPDNDEPQYSIDIIDVGNHKNMYWEYENEWRYKISHSSKLMCRGTAIKNENVANEPDIKALFVPIRREIEEILLGPETTDEDYDEIREFLNEKKLDHIPLLKSSIRLRDM